MPCAHLHSHGYSRQAGAEENTQHIHQLCLSLARNEAQGASMKQKMKALSNLSIGKMQTQFAGASLRQRSPLYLLTGHSYQSTARQAMAAVTSTQPC